jgi:hypothetical protein
LAGLGDHHPVGCLRGGVEMKLDWLDIALHVAAAGAMMAMVHYLGLWGAAIANGVLWPYREWDQRRLRGKEPWRWSAQNHWEAWPPAIVGVVLAASLT